MRRSGEPFSGPAHVADDVSLTNLLFRVGIVGDVLVRIEVVTDEDFGINLSGNFADERLNLFGALAGRNVQPQQLAGFVIDDRFNANLNPFRLEKRTVCTNDRSLSTAFSSRFLLFSGLTPAF